MEYRIPTDWSDITLPQYLRFHAALAPYEGTEMYGEKLLDRAALHLCGISAEVLRRMPQSQFDEIAQTLSGFITDSNRTLVKEFQIGDVTYGFLPDIQNMSYGEYLDLVEYAKRTWDNITTIMSILYRPVTGEDKWGRYTIEEYRGTDDRRVELFAEKLTMDVVFGALDFFFQLSKELLTHTLSYSKAEMRRHLTTVEQTLGSSGRRTLQLIDSLVETSSNTTE